MSHAWYYDAKWLTKAQRNKLRELYKQDLPAYYKFSQLLLSEHHKPMIRKVMDKR